MKTITQHTHFEDSRIVVLADGTQARVEFKKVPLVKRDPVVRVYMKASNQLVRIATGRLTQECGVAVVGFIAGNDVPDVVDIELLGNALQKINPMLYDMHLGA